MRGTHSRSWCVLVAVGGSLALTGCSSTTDAIGSDEPIALDAGPRVLLPLVCGGRTVNAFFELLGISDADVKARIDEVFERLFHGDPDQEAFYVPVGKDQAFVKDTYHNEEARTEGIGLAMNIAVKLGHREEFDRLWRWSVATIQDKDGRGQGYFWSRCDEVGDTVSCYDPYGMEQLTMALIFAHERWGSDSGDIDYEQDALELLDLMRREEAEDGAGVDSVTSIFDEETALPYHLPSPDASDFTRPAVVIPAYYRLWAQATGDRFWMDATERGREYLRATCHPGTGFYPVRAFFDGKPVPGWGDYQPEAYRAQVNVVLDWLWGWEDLWTQSGANRVISFFGTKVVEPFCRSYSHDGSQCVDTEAADPSLAAVNAIAALASTQAERVRFIRALWDAETPTGDSRYYGGLLHLIALMMVGGQYPICSG